MRSLPLFHRIAGTRVVVVGDGPMAEAKKRLVTRAGGMVCSEAEAHHARLAFVALEDERAAKAAAQRLKTKGLLVNVADMPKLCDFTLPSILERDPVLIAISTSGASAGLAKHLRLRMEAMMPQSIGQLAQRLADARDRLRHKFPLGEDRRRALDEALGEGGALDVLDGDAVARLDEWLSGNQSLHESQTVEIELTSDDPEDLTLKQARLLGMADTILHDANVPQAILNRARADAELIELTSENVALSGITVVLKRS